MKGGPPDWGKGSKQGPPDFGKDGGKGGFGPIVGKGGPTMVMPRSGPYNDPPGLGGLPGGPLGGPPGGLLGGPPGLGPPAQVNELGLPIRPGREQCLVYLNTGICQNGLACIFDHPKGVRPPMPGKGGGCGMPILPPPVSPGAIGTGGSAPGLLPNALPPGIMPVRGEAPPVPTGSAPPLPTDAQPPAPGGDRAKDGDDKDAKPGDAKGVPAPEPKMGPVLPVQFNDDGMPIRPGVQKCGFYLRSGVCNYGPTCRFDHPPGLGGIMAGGQGFGNFPLMVGGPTTTEGGMARRPGKDQCPFLARTGTCPFGPECRFDHQAGAAGGDDAARRPPPRSQQPPVKDKGLGGQRGRRPVSNSARPPASFSGFRRP